MQISKNPLRRPFGLRAQIAVPLLAIAGVGLLAGYHVCYGTDPNNLNQFADTESPHAETVDRTIG